MAAVLIVVFTNFENRASGPISFLQCCPVNGYPLVVTFSGYNFFSWVRISVVSCVSVSNQNKIYGNACTLFRRRNENVQHFLRNVFVILNLTSEASDEAYALAGWTLLVASLSGDAFVVL